MLILAALPLAVGLLWFAGGGFWPAWLLGAGFGFVMLGTAFSFAGAFRRLLGEARGLGARAVLLALGAALLLCLPAIAAGEALGQPARGLYFPVGVAALLGAFVFGLGMQLGSGCASGTLFSAGSGEPRPWITLLAFIAGATLAAWALPMTESWPVLPPKRLLEGFGLWPTLAGSLALVALAWLGLLWWERRRHGTVERLGAAGPGRWLLWGALGVALLEFTTLAVIGRPWAITTAMPFWGSRLLDATGWGDPSFWPYWDEPTRAEMLFRRLDEDRTSVMNLGVIAGAALAAGLTGRFLRGPLWPGARPALAAVLGGGLIGVGAVLANGCNIGAFFGGALSGSLHGWLWLPAGLLGNWVGLQLRPMFRLPAR